MKILVNTITTKKYSGGAYQIANNFVRKTLEHSEISWEYVVSKDLDEILPDEMNDKENYHVFPTQPDYKGTLRNGFSIVFEAKHTDTDRIKRAVITDEQEKRLDKHLALGAECFVLYPSASTGSSKFRGKCSDTWTDTSEGSMLRQMILTSTRYSMSEAYLSSSADRSIVWTK